MPGGWPAAESEREACARALLASGGDFERIFDDSEIGVDAYIRHIIRVPFFRLAHESPIVLVTGKIHTATLLLEFYTHLFELTDQFNQASWLTYIAHHHLSAFLNDARTWGEVEEVERETYCWFTSPSPILIINECSHASGLRRAVADLESVPKSGVIALPSTVSPVSTQLHNHIKPTPAASNAISSGSIARLSIKRQPSRADLPADRTDRRSPTPPNNPRIRSNTG